jgi:hypothetical protein
MMIQHMFFLASLMLALVDLTNPMNIRFRLILELHLKIFKLREIILTSIQ